tara:strand:- start:78 stop:206 length:129 start_codon:yes stop_codon:yes gene_type:complete
LETQKTKSTKGVKQVTPIGVLNTALNLQIKLFLKNGLTKGGK